MASSKVIVLTGASRGIGLAVAHHLLKASHRVLLVSRSRAELQELKDQYPSRAEYFPGDLSDTQAAPQVIKAAIAAFGRLDGLIINHGTLFPMQRVASSSFQDWKRVFDTNFFSALALVNAAIPHLRATKGKLVFTGSGAATHAYASWGPYGSSKAALNSLGGHVAAEEPDITVVCVVPGRADTEMQKRLRESGRPGTLMAQEDYDKFAAASEEGTLIQPERPGHVIAKLVLEAKAELSGQCLK